MKEKSRPTLAFIGVLVFGFVFYFLMIKIQPFLGEVLFSYDTWDSLRSDNFLYRLFWMLGDPLEPHFHKSLIGGISLLIGSFIAFYLDRKNSQYKGIPMAYGQSNIWLWVLATSMISLGISVALFGGLHIDGDNYIPSFVPYVSVAPAILFLYGANLPALFTGAILGALTTTPIAIFIRYTLCLPNDLIVSGLPGVVAATSGMWLGGIVTFEICKHLPWMELIDNSNSEDEEIVGEDKNSLEYRANNPNKFLIRRMLADYSEPMFVGNEIAGAFLILGTLLSWFLNPKHPAYGSGLLPHIILSQIITGAVAMYIYWEGWLENDWFPSFVPVVSVAPACILQFGGTMPVILISSLLGGLICPPIAQMVNRNIPKHWHIYIGLTFSMAFSSFVVSIILKYVGMVIPIF